ncbi:MAG TPA: hypothetical protein VEJ86_11600 [Candidatus Binataceae bacterium]|nr:hypothetical protein [Candidatus Binataceae bacterium]
MKLLHHAGLPIATLALLVMTAAWLGCGVKSPPIPPQYSRPQRIADLRAESLANGVQLTWSRPETYAGGARLRALGSFTVMRSERKGAFQKIAEIQVTDQQRFQVQTVFRYVDEATAVGQTYDYRVTASTTDGYVSEPSNDAIVTRVVPPPAPNPETYMLPTPTPIPSLP